MEGLGRKDCCRLAALHCECIADSMVTRLGRSYAEAFYRYVSRSTEERVFVLRDAAEIFRGCVLTLSPKTLRRRLLIHTPLLWYAIPWLCRKLLAKRRPARLSQESDLPVGSMPDLPELILLFTAPGSRNQGAGAALLAQCEQFLAGQGSGEYLVKTIEDESNRELLALSK